MPGLGRDPGRHEAGGLGAAPRCGQSEAAARRRGTGPTTAPGSPGCGDERGGGGGCRVNGEADGKTAAAAAEHSQRELDTVTLEDIKEHVKQLEKAVSGKEPRFVLRALRMLPSTSRRLNHYVLYKAVHGFFTANNTTRDFLLSFLEEPMDTEADFQFRPRTGKAAAAPSCLKWKPISSSSLSSSS